MKKFHSDECRHSYHYSLFYFYFVDNHSQVFGGLWGIQTGSLLLAWIRWVGYNLSPVFVAYIFSGFGKLPPLKVSRTRQPRLFFAQHPWMYGQLPLDCFDAEKNLKHEDSQATFRVWRSRICKQISAHVQRTLGIMVFSESGSHTESKNMYIVFVCDTNCGNLAPRVLK